MPERISANREEWVAERRNSVGASESPALFGEGYSDQTPLTLYEEKLNGRPESDADHLQLGTDVEPGIRRAFERRTGFVTVPAEPLKTWIHNDRPWMTATPDGFTVEDGGEARGTLEMKLVGIGQMEEWRDGPPSRVLVQVQQQMAVLGVAYAYIAALIGTTLHVSRHEPNPVFVEKLLKTVDAFWALVKSGTPPQATSKVCDTRALRLLHPDDSGETIQLPDGFMSDYDELKDVKANIKILKDRETFLKHQFCQAIGDGTFGELPDGRRCSWKTSTVHEQPREARERKQRTFRLLKK